MRCAWPIPFTASSWLPATGRPVATAFCSPPLRERMPSIWIRYAKRSDEPATWPTDVRPRPTIALMCLAALVVAAAPVSGSIIVPMLDEDLVVHADAIVVGTVTGIVSHRDPTDNIATYVTIDIEEVLKGSLSGHDVTIRELGGSVGVHHAWVFASPVF